MPYLQYARLVKLPPMMVAMMMTMVMTLRIAIALLHLLLLLLMAGVLAIRIFGSCYSGGIL